MTETGKAISPDSGEHWSAPGAWPVAEGIHRIPLPLPMDGLRAVNVYVIETEDGLTLVDGGWAITEGREALERGLAQLGRGFTDIRTFLVTHAHRDHYTLAAVLGAEFGATVVLGIGERKLLRAANGDVTEEASIVGLLRQTGAHELAEVFLRMGHEDGSDPGSYRFPDEWLTSDVDIPIGERTLAAVHTPGHTQGHYVYADRAVGLLFAGDHVLPTITPSIGFESVPVQQPLRDFLASLAKVRAMPDLRLLPAHGPVAPSVHERVDELVVHHEHRLGLCLLAIQSRPRTSVEVAAELPWTRHDHAFSTLDAFNAALAAMETKAHLELLVARGQAVRTETEAGAVFAPAASRRGGSCVTRPSPPTKGSS